MVLYRHREKTKRYEKGEVEMKGLVEKIEEKISISDEMVAKKLQYLLNKGQTGPLGLDDASWEVDCFLSDLGLNCTVNRKYGTVN